jgi:nucleoside-diphosphate-sugar epimerase
MRFDIVLNNLAGLAWTTREIKMTSDGTPWRPLIHGLDIARAIIAVLQAPTEAIHNEVFNVGDTSHNYRVREIAETVGNALPVAGYRLATKRGQSQLPGFLRKDPQALARIQMQVDARGGGTTHNRRIDMTREAFEYRTSTRLKQLQYLIRTQQIDPQFFWTNEAEARSAS